MEWNEVERVERRERKRVERKVEDILFEGELYGEPKYGFGA